MMIPSRKNFFDEVFNEPMFSKKEAKIMKTDIKEKDGNYIFTIDVPGFEKENINIELESGYLTVSATMNEDVDDEERNGKYIYKERYSGECSRSFYVGEDVKEEDVKKLGLPYITIPNGYKIEVNDTLEATNLIVNNRELFVDYELIKGKMDDVFLNITGRRLRE